MPAPAVIICEISARDPARVRALAGIARVCAEDVGQPLTLRPFRRGVAGGGALLTLHLPAELAASQHQVWCLACRLACFCPDARVSVLVHGETSFGPTPARHHRRSAERLRKISAD